MSESRPFPYGGEAVFDGVMMRGASTWALAVRTPSGAIKVETHALAPWMTATRRIPLVRGVMALSVSVVLGVRSLHASMRHRSSEPEPALAKVLSAIGVAVILSIFLAAPALLVRLLDDLTTNPWVLSTVESLVRLLMLLGYIGLLGRAQLVRDVFRYHSAEHQAIAARESGVTLEPSTVARYPWAHARCGTSFLFFIVVVGLVIHALVGNQSAVVIVASRVLVLPLIAGLTFELIRQASRHLDTKWARIIAAPGLAMQRLTTREPTEAHIEVAIAALEAVVAADAKHRVGAASLELAPA